jgi:hypothetical protein
MAVRASGAGVSSKSHFSPEIIIGLAMAAHRLFAVLLLCAALLVQVLAREQPDWDGEVQKIELEEARLNNEIAGAK